MDFIGEYDDFTAIPRNIAVTYKFFDLFKVTSEDGVRVLTWGKSIKCSLDTPTLDAIKAFLKATKSGLRNGEYTASECSKRMWFFYTKLIEHGAFSSAERMEILKWMDVCQWVIT